MADKVSEPSSSTCTAGKSSLSIQRKGKADEANYIMSQSTDTYLTVLNGSGPSDAEVGLAPYTGGAEQQWFANGDQWQWGANRSYCLEPDFNTNTVGLGDANSSSATWTYDEADRMVTGTKALDVPWQEPRTSVILYSLHDGMNQKWKIRSAPNAEVDYLISQSTITCLTVRSGSTPEDAVVGLARCSGKENQQWFNEFGTLLWGGNKSYSLVPDYNNRIVKLGDPAQNPAVWTLDEADRMIIGSYAMDVPWQAPRTSVVLYPPHDGLNQKWWTLSGLKALLEGATAAEYPFPATDELTFKQEMARGIINQLTLPTNPLPYERDLATFPGTVPTDTPRINKTVTLDLSVLGQNRNFRMTVPQDWQATDLYVVAGDVFKVILPASLSPERAAQITVRVSAHVDFLQPTSSNVAGSGEFQRMPIVTEVFDVSPGENTLRSQYNGNLVFIFSEGENFTVDVQVQNVAKSLYIKLGETPEDKQISTPYAILETEEVVLVAPTSAAQGVTDTDGLLQRYDEVMGMMTYAAGFDETEEPPRGKFWLVDDKQITAGSAHAGFPVMLTQAYYDLTNENTPYDWVYWHEVGHNFQQGPYWSYAYGSESTVNLFSLYIQEKLFDEDRLEQQNDYVRAADDVDNGMTFDEGDVWEQLVFLMEIKHAFPGQGWEMFRQLRRLTRALSEEDAATLASNHQNQIDHVYKNLSRIVGSDLILTYQRWSLPVSQETQDEIAALGLPKAPGDLSHRPPYPTRQSKEGMYKGDPKHE